MPYKMLYPKDAEKNKQFRLDILQRAEGDSVFQGLILKKCEEDPLFFVNVFGWTYDPRTEDRNLPFITYEFQDETILEFIYCIEHGLDVFLEKSRDMGASWMMIAVQTWCFLFKMWPSLYGSYKETYVNQHGNMDSHFERLRYFFDSLPIWMLPEDIEKTGTNISSKILNCSISGDAGPNFGTGGRRKFTVLDEFAYWQYDEKAFRKTADISQCKIIMSTPEGKYNVFGMIGTRAEGTEYEHLDIRRIRLHWTRHPNKDQAWYLREKGKRTPLSVAKELDISYEDSVTGAVYPEFKDRAVVTRVPFNPKLPLFTSWDFGRDMNVIIWFQKDYYTNMVYVVDSIQIPNSDIEYMAAFVTGEPSLNESTGMPYQYTDDELAMIERHKNWLPYYAFHCGDPYNADSTQTNANASIRKILLSFGIVLRTNRKSTVEERIRKTKLLFFRLVVDQGQLALLQAITQSRYPDASKNSTRERTIPIHNVYSHMRTALEYFADNEVNEYLNKAQEEPEVEEDTATYNYVTGRWE